MIWIAYTVLFFTAVQLIVALVNLFTRTHLPYSGKAPERKVSILIPSRNEEKNIGCLLADLKNQKGIIEILVFDDQSEDNTAAVVKQFAETDHRISLISSDRLPTGWLGKNYACHSLGKHATGDYLLFLDADVRVEGNLTGDAIAYAENSGSHLVSIFPMQRIVTQGEWATVPNMNYILVSLLPLVLVRKTPFRSLAAANGQFMLFRAETYSKLHPHEKMKNNKVEDILIARYFKKKGLAVTCMLGDERISCRMYTGFSDAVNGFSKNVAEFFGGSHIISIAFWLLTTFGFLAVFLYLPLSVSLAWLAMYLLTRIAVALSARQNIIRNIIYIIPLQLSLGAFIVKSLAIRFSKKYLWKGREIS